MSHFSPSTIKPENIQERDSVTEKHYTSRHELPWNKEPISPGPQWQSLFIFRHHGHHRVIYSNSNLRGIPHPPFISVQGEFELLVFQTYTLLHTNEKHGRKRYSSSLVWFLIIYLLACLHLSIVLCLVRFKVPRLTSRCIYRIIIIQH